MENIIIEGGTGEIVEKKSRFIANVRPVKNEEEAMAFVNEMKKKYWDARHNCMAYAINGGFKFSDDGEPSGTAGKPILDVIVGRQLMNVAVVVTRYFGGILLGTGGLVRAYQKAAIEGLNNSVLAEKQNGYIFDIITDYNGLGKIQYIASNENVHITNVDYTEDVKITVVCEKKKSDGFVKNIIEVTSGKAEVSEMKEIDFYTSDKGIFTIE